MLLTQLVLWVAAKLDGCAPLTSTNLTAGEGSPILLQPRVLDCKQTIAPSRGCLGRKILFRGVAQTARPREGSEGGASVQCHAEELPNQSLGVDLNFL